MNRLIYFFLLISFQLISQNYPQDYFRAPVDIPMVLAGNFGELRSNHFHAGIDIKTQGVEGIPIYASAEGYVSRIKIQHYGYGKAIYITHPNGYTTVYAHLKKFSPKIEKLVQEKQYQDESYTIQIFPQKDQLFFEKGELIAYSGNSGGSGGPHLHFEIRETKTEHPLNPLLFGFDIKDDIKPIIKGVRVYPMGLNSYLGSGRKSQYLSAVGDDGDYQLRFKDTIRVHGTIGIGIETIDKLNGAYNRCGVFDVKMYRNNDLVYSHNMSCIPFSESRYINSHTEYAYRVKTGKWIHKCFKEPNNQLSIYATNSENGLMNFCEDSQDTIRFEITDVNNNQSELTFVLTGKKNQIPLPELVVPNKKGELSYGEAFSYADSSIQIDIPKGAMYNDYDFTYNFIDQKGSYCGLHEIMDLTIPVHKYYHLKIKPDSIFSDSSKMCIVSFDKNNNKIYEGGEWEKEWLKVKTRSFGTYSIDIDTVSPVIKGYNIYNGKNISRQSTIKIKISDNFSGIDKYRVTSDGKWLLFEYDYKRNMLTHYIDEKITKGQHTLKVEVSDNRGNVSTETYKFIR